MRPALHEGQERIDLFFGRGPARGEAYDRVAIVGLFPEAHADVVAVGLIPVVGDLDDCLLYTSPSPRDA